MSGLYSVEDNIPKDTHHVHSVSKTDTSYPLCTTYQIIDTSYAHLIKILPQRRNIPGKVLPKARG